MQSLGSIHLVTKTLKKNITIVLAQKTGWIAQEKNVYASKCIACYKNIWHCLLRKLVNYVHVRNVTLQERREKLHKQNYTIIIRV